MPQAVAIAMDMSFDLLIRQLWSDSKAGTTMVVESLREFSGEMPIVVGYAETAQILDPADFPELEIDYIYGTNVQHALQVARYALDEKHGRKRVLLVAEADPTAHCITNGDVQFDYPPTEETRDITLNEARLCALAGIRIDVLLLTPDSQFRGFADRIASECGGSVRSLSLPLPAKDEVRAIMSSLDME
jgi:uncharacterized protein with von Willebrand factor type A (vWA) domain